MSYRFYTLDLNDHINSARDEDCADDQEAVRRAEALRSSWDIEIWHGARRVARVPAQSDTPAIKSHETTHR